jgi:hypothetical protein
MQFNRKYYLMLLLLSILIILSSQGDSDLFSIRRYNKLNSTTVTTNTAYNLVPSSEFITNEISEATQKTEDMLITESKLWVIDKNFVLGY